MLDAGGECEEENPERGRADHDSFARVEKGVTGQQEVTGYSQMDVGVVGGEDAEADADQERQEKHRTEENRGTKDAVPQKSLCGVFLRSV